MPGGLCTAWDRGPYRFDGCLQWLLGTHPSSTFHQIWRELGVFAGQQIVNHDEFIRIEGADGEALSVVGDLDALAREFTRIAPEDAARIRRLVRAARRCAPLEPPIEKPLEIMSPLEKLRTGLRYLPMVPVIARWKKLPLTAYLARYQNPFLREALGVLAGDARVSALVLVMVLALRSRKNAGYLAGGSRALTQAMANRYASLGGLVRCNATVDAVAVANGRASGVRCADGTDVPAAVVVSCADGHTTLFKMLGGRFVNEDIRFAYETCETFHALVQVSLGINTTFPGAPHALSLRLPHPLRVDNETRHPRIEVTIYNANSALCPEGKTVMTTRLFSRCEYWVNLRHTNPDLYQMEKENILREVVGALDRRFPGLARNLECSDVATPATFVRHTGNWRGSFQGWLPTPRILGRRLPRTLPGLEDFYMAGHWVEPGGGLPFAALSGRYVAQLICARKGRRFVATER
jgi:phytoene dehydrogenase-like protein